MNGILPAITLYQPWATWIMRGWKDIETRTHGRFKCLKGKYVLIHAGMNTDTGAFNNPYLTEEQQSFNPDEMVNGAILGYAHVCQFGVLDERFAARALIECDQTLRYGLFLHDITRFDSPIPEKGEMGIWYYDLDKRMKVKKNKTKQPTLF